jgi:hypothetical protein
VKAALLAIALAASSAPPLAEAQATPAEMPPHHHPPAPASESAPRADAAPTLPAAMVMTGMRGQFGPYAMARESSGTSWQPEATPMEMLHTMNGEWMLMLHGLANLVVDRQSGPRGDSKTFSQSMLMAMASRPLGAGTLGLRGMFSLDPTMGRSGYPLLLQTGESADGRTPLIDRQHPHDALMELSSSYSLPLASVGSAFVYTGLPGEPALGPPTFMHRASGMRNPEAPISHHWFDATHVSFGVVSAGVIAGPLKLEASRFNGREPDEQRWNIETRRLDSWSTRLSWNPSAAWSLQTSYGYLKSPEALEPETSVRRLTASAIYQGRLAGRDWATTLAWSRNDKRGLEGSATLPALLLESSWAASERDSVFGRFERVRKDELFEPGDARHGSAFEVAKLSLGYVRDFASTGPIRWGLGGVVGVLRVPAALESTYGRRPMSYLLFLQGRIAP